MKDEIKEILDLKIDCDYKRLSVDEIVILKDYITNLQEENEKLKGLVNPTTQIFIDTQDMEERYGQELYEDYLKEQLEVYKSRIEKAIEYINQNKHLSMFADCREPEEDWDYDLEINPRDLLNILQGVDKE